MFRGSSWTVSQGTIEAAHRKAVCVLVVPLLGATLMEKFSLKPADLIAMDLAFVVPEEIKKIRDYTYGWACPDPDMWRRYIVKLPDVIGYAEVEQDGFPLKIRVTRSPSVRRYEDSFTHSNLAFGFVFTVMEPDW